MTIPLAGARPGVFQIPRGSGGVFYNPDGALNWPGSPIDRGQVLTLYATGQGVLDPPQSTGELAPASPFSIPRLPVSVSFGGQPGRVLESAMAPDAAGVLMVRAEVPADTPTGNAVPVVLTIGGVSSQPGVTLAVR